MNRQTIQRVVLTLAFVFGLFALAVLRTNGWRLQSWSSWVMLQSKRASSNPEDAIYSMLDAARAGDTKTYLDSFSGPMRDQLLQIVKESSEPKFASYLTRTAAFRGVAVTITDRPNSEEVQARVEYVYSDRNEVQKVYLKREGDRWKIFKMADAEQIKTLIPFGTAVAD